jgi:hypothetical protein
VADSLRELASRVEPGQQVTLTDATGRETEGRIVEVSGAVLRLVVKDHPMDFAEADIARVSRRDSRWNGTLWGLAAGVALGVWLEASLAEEYGRDDIGYGEVLVPLAALGSGVGFVADALIGGQHVLYAAPRASNTTAAARPQKAWAVVASWRF